MSFATLGEVAKDLVSNNSSKNLRVCFVVAGGGGQAISSLACTPGASSLLLEGTVAYDRSSYVKYLEDEIEEDSDFQYVSEEAAQQLSKAALDRALKYTGVGQYANCIGVACTSALVNPNGRKGRMSRGHVCATMADGRQWGCNINLVSGRHRAEEDVVLSRLALLALEQITGQDDKGDKVYAGLDEGDELDTWSNDDSSSTLFKDAVIEGANRILSDEQKAVLLVPQGEDSYMQMPEVMLPQEKLTLVFPGSFNPPHKGHLSLAKAAFKTLKCPKSTPVLMEVSLSNADKPSLEANEVSRRVNLLRHLEKDDLPEHWGVLLTSAPLFKEKVDLLRESGNAGPLVFVIGTDTMVRITDPKYYNGSTNKMIESLSGMGNQGVKFVVGGRLEQGESADEAKFINGKDELDAMLGGEDIKSLFTIIPEAEFREDISSTELRKKALEAPASPKAESEPEPQP